MKKLFLSIVAMCAISYASQAQVKFSIMPKAGISLSNVAVSDELKSGLQEDFESNFDLKSRLGLTGGVAFNLAFGEAFSIQPELLFVQKGFRIKEDIQGTTLKADFILNYLELPILAKYSFGNDKIRAYVNAGPSFGLGLSGKYKVKATNGGQSYSQEYKVKFGDEPANNNSDIYLDNRIDLGLQFGAGVGYQVGPGQVVLDARYGLGLSNWVDAKNGVTKEQAKSQNRSLQFTLGYMIPLGN